MTRLLLTVVFGLCICAPILADDERLPKPYHVEVSYPVTSALGSRGWRTIDHLVGAWEDEPTQVYQITTLTGTERTYYSFSYTQPFCTGPGHAIGFNVKTLDGGDVILWNVSLEIRAILVQTKPRDDVAKNERDFRKEYHSEANRNERLRKEETRIKELFKRRAAEEKDNSK